MEARAEEVRLSDGRVLAYAEWGPPNGRPLFHCHGIPDGRFGWGASSACENRDIRLIAVDRPGIGGSDPKPGRCVADWSTDVEELAERLELDRFTVTGWSGGAAYALACAHKLQSRIDGVALVGGAGRLDLPGFIEQMSTAMAWKLAGRVPSAMTLAYGALARIARRSPGTAQRILSSGLPKVDRAVVGRPEVGRRWVAAYVEAARASGRGLTEDMQTLLRRWDFEPAEIRIPVHLIHGKCDTVAPPAHAGYWIETLEAARPVWVEDAGHFLIEDHAEEIFDTLHA